MPLKYFDCPDNQRRLITQCIVACPRPEGRCLSLPTLFAVGKQREWNGTPSTTQLLKGTRLAYLEIVKDYAENPLDSAFKLLGMRHHHQLDVIAKKLDMLSEKPVGSGITGILDLLEPDELEPECYKLIDYKTSGSYAVAKALGRKNGNPDITEWELQLNNYRLEVEKLGFPISRMFIQACVRDGGTFSARNNRVPEKLLLIPIKKIDDNFIKTYFYNKAKALLDALESKTLPPMCEWDERWGNRRCFGGFCPVVEFCPEGSKMTKQDLQKEMK